jgi:hypothetical protein
MTKAKAKAKAKAMPKRKAPTKKRQAASSDKGGRPTKYQAAYAKQVHKLCLLGATDVEIARFFEVSETTINTWKQKHPPFARALRTGKTMADAEVASRLYERAVGYSHPEEKIMQHEGKVIRARTTKHYPPETQAGSLWLRNRQPDKWRDKIDHELAGAGGGPIEFRRTQLTDEQLIAIATQGQSE